MSQTKRQKRRTPSPDSSGSEDSLPTPPRGLSPPPGPHVDCAAYCCKRGEDWVSRQFITETYTNGPSEDLLDTGGCWKLLRVQVGLMGEHLRKWGLIPWQNLDPEVQSRFSSWSPVAKELWESDFLAHPEAMVQAWIWHYLDDYLFSFAGNQQDGALKLRSPVWEHVRALRRDLDVLRARQANFHDVVYRHQFQVWSRLTEHLVRGGLDDMDVFDPEELATHFKRSLRRIAARRDEIPDGAYDGGLCKNGDIHDPADRFDSSIRSLLQSACRAQYFIHGMEGGYALRFTPVGDHAGKMFDIPFNPIWMEENNPIEVPTKRPNDPVYPRVQLVTQPMLAANSKKSPSENTTFTLLTPMRVVTPWTFGGEGARPHVLPGLEKGWHLRMENQRKLLQMKYREEQQKEQQKLLTKWSKDGESQAKDGHAIADSKEDTPCE
ncbi:uncharacterized protein B0H64DRAFT_170728 [Chaetomium fimeti]|uniref:Uncharacterized protein n=1 Tax=Chaetomium fimeti TaxID=1854472 RepID=A0AAE0LST1_9PEZI|nr:hypothetical protein B0H64DRAFT_170728 [Chaetomium fimeti]